MKNQENKSEKPHECEWCGVNFGGWKRKYCTPKCREEEKAYKRNKAKIARAKKRQEKRLLREKEEQDKRIAKLDKELQRLREENRKLNCIVCDKELTGKQTLYCSDACSKLNRVDDLKRPVRAESIFNDGSKWHEGHYGKCNIDIVESKNTLLAIDLKPYTVEDDYYIEKCISEELPVARYTDGSFYSSKLHKGSEFYYGPNYCERSFAKYRKKSAVKNFITLLKHRIKQLEWEE